MSVARTAMLGIAILHAVATPALPQRVIQITGDPVCRECRIVAEKVASLRAPTGTPRFVFPSRVARDHAGMWYVADPMGTTAVAVFDPTGRLVRSLSNPSMELIDDVLVTAGDSVRVLGGDRVSVFDAEGKAVRTDPILERGSRATRALVLRNNRVVLSARVGSADLFGYPYHILRPDWSRERSVGAEDNTAAVAGSFEEFRRLAPALKDGFWAARVNRYELSLWTLDGKLQTVVRRDVDWFRPWIYWDSRFDTSRPPPRLMWMWHDPSDRLWVMTSVAAADWKPSTSSGVSAEVISGSSDTMLDVIDLRTATLLTSQRFSQAFWAFVGDGYLLEVMPQGPREASAELWRVTFLQRGGAR